MKRKASETASRRWRHSRDRVFGLFCIVLTCGILASGTSAGAGEHAAVSPGSNEPRPPLKPLAAADGAKSTDSASQRGSPGERSNVPRTGQRGITETVEQIMAREAQHARNGLAAASREVRPHLIPRLLRQDNSEVSPTANSQVKAPVPLADFTAKGFTPQLVSTNFLGAQISDTIGYIPPDSMGTVGPTQVMVVVNGRIRIFSKSGTLGGLDVTTDNFFNSVRSASTSDPHARYDRLTQRWFVSMIDVATTNRILIAVSSGPTITNTSSFTFFEFQHDLVGPTPNSDTGGFADYDTLGVDRFALYIGVNVFNSAGTALLGTTGFVVNKSNLLSGTLTVAAFRQMADSSGAGPITPQGVDNDDPNATEGYFIGVDGTTFGQLDIRRIITPGGTPSISNLSVTVPSTTLPISQVHAGNTLHKNLDALDDRLFAAAIRRNKITGTTSLWTAHNIQVNSSGNASSSGGRNGSRWYEINNLTGTPALVQSGTLFDSAASRPRGFWIPSVIASGQGHMVLGCSYASLNDFAGVATAGRFRTDASGSIQSPTLAVVSSTAYNISETSNPHRWGDFSQVAVDPTDDMTMWTFQEYCNAADSWGVQAIKLLAPPPVTPTNASPATLTPSQSAINVVITGNSVSGSEFFDPGTDSGGPGFPNHLQAAVNGGGVTVNSVSFSNPTNLTINVTVAANAAAGARTVTVTNPDGQTATSSTGILSIAAVLPIVNFTAGPTNGPARLTVIFTNLTSGATNYSWAFGDGDVSSALNPTNTYASAGTYTVSLTAVGLGGTNILTRTNYIVVTNPPPVVAGFVAGPTNGLVPLTVLFTNLTSGATNYSWSFGDGNVSSTVSPTNTYASAGIYTVSLTAVGLGGTNILTRTNYIVVTNPPPVVASFDAGPTNGLVPLTVLFTNLSSGATNYSWSFGDGNVSSAVNPTNTYASAGTYTVSLTAVGLGGTNILTRTNYVFVTNPPRLVVAPASLDFGLIGPGDTTVAFLVVSNAGTVGLTGSAAISPGDFAILSGTPFSLDPSSSTNLVIRFAPTTSGAFTNAVTFASNGGGSSNTLTGRAITSPSVQALPFNGTNFVFSFETVLGFTYDVQYKDALTDAVWQPLTSVAGDGTVQTILVPVTSPAQRFYRLRVE